MDIVATVAINSAISAASSGRTVPVLSGKSDDYLREQRRLWTEKEHPTMGAYLRVASRSDEQQNNSAKTTNVNIRAALRPWKMALVHTLVRYALRMCPFTF